MSTSVSQGPHHSQPDPTIDFTVPYIEGDPCSLPYFPRLQTKGTNVMTTTSNTNSDVISSDKVEGTTVYNTGGDKLGSIDDLMLDKISGQVRYAVLEFGGFLGVGTDRYPIPWKVLKYSTDKGGYIVPLDKAALDQAPKYSENKAPIYDRDYGSRINSYYDRY